MPPDQWSCYLGRRYAGNVPCFEFVRDFLADHGLALPRYDYPRLAHLEALRRHLVEHGEPVADPRFGDVAVMRVVGDPVHIGVMLDDRRVIHHTRVHGVLIDRVDSPARGHRVAGYWRPRLPGPAQ